MSVEAAASHAWRRWIGDHGCAVGLVRFGASAPGPIVVEMLGFTVERVAEEARAALGEDPARLKATPV